MEIDYSTHMHSLPPSITWFVFNPEANRHCGSIVKIVSSWLLKNAYNFHFPHFTW